MPKPREIQDKFFKLAKAEGYAARSAYKLKEIQERRRIIRRGDRVLDLGCAPGSWVQVASELVGDKGLVVGIDLNPVTITLPPNARTMVGDIFKVTAEELLGASSELGTRNSEGKAKDAESSPSLPSSEFRPPRFDVVLSDMMPLTEGHGDHFRSVALCRRVLGLAPAMLKPRGHLVIKVFEGEEYPALLKETAKLFGEVKGVKPESTRDVSKEMFIVAKEFRPPATNASPPPTPHAIAPAPPKPKPGWGSTPQA